MLVMKKKLTTISLGFVLLFANLNFMCNKNTDVQKAAVAASDVQTVIDTTTDSVAQLYHDGILSKEKTHQVALLLQKINGANGVLISTAKSMNSDSTINRCILAGQLLVVANAIKDLQAAGVLGIKSKTGALVFDTALASIIADIKVVAAIIGQCANPVVATLKQ